MIIIQASCMKVQTTSDRSLRVYFETQEADEEQAKQIITAHGKFGWLIFNEKILPTVEELDLPDVTPDFKGEKSPSQRLRAVLYRVWEQLPEKPDEKKMAFEIFYRAKMDELIDHFKGKLV